jgi:uncharacterized membrane protein
MTPRVLNRISGVLLIALIALCVSWEVWWAPLRPGGSWMMLKALPLMAALSGILRGRRYTHQWLSMLVLLYLVEGVVRATDAGLAGTLAIAEAVLAALLFASSVLYARAAAPSRQARAGD